MTDAATMPPVPLPVLFVICESCLGQRPERCRVCDGSGQDPTPHVTAAGPADICGRCVFCLGPFAGGYCPVHAQVATFTALDQKAVCDPAGAAAAEAALVAGGVLLDRSAWDTSALDLID